MSSGFEWLCLIPPLFIVVWAVITKKTFSALIIGAALSYVLMYQLDFFTPFVDALYAVIMDLMVLAVLVVSHSVRCSAQRVMRLLLSTT